MSTFQVFTHTFNHIAWIKENAACLTLIVSSALIKTEHNFAINQSTIKLWSMTQWIPAFIPYTSSSRIAYFSRENKFLHWLHWLGIGDAYLYWISLKLLSPLNRNCRIVGGQWPWCLWPSWSCPLQSVQLLISGINGTTFARHQQSAQLYEHTTSNSNLFISKIHYEQINELQTTTTTTTHIEQCVVNECSRIYLVGFIYILYIYIQRSIQKLKL